MGRRVKTAADSQTDRQQLTANGVPRATDIVAEMLQKTTAATS